MGGTLCNFGTQLKFYLNYDDALDIFAVHTIGGIVGNVCWTSVGFSLNTETHRLLNVGAHGDLRTEICCGL